jgi:dephospho-CoA kinase
VLALTGGIGSGKSSVSSLLAEHGARVIDADAVARQVVAPGRPAHEKVVTRFGADVVAADGSLDRAALADIVFGDPAARADLNAIVHPAVGQEIERQLAAVAEEDAVVVVEVPLLVETGWTFDLVVVVDCPKEVALRRLVDGRGMDEADVRRRMSAQASRKERLARADAVIDNSGSLEDLPRAVDRFWRELPNLTALKRPAEGADP